jgi:hypothetical protein
MGGPQAGQMGLQGVDVFAAEQVLAAHRRPGLGSGLLSPPQQWLIGQGFHGQTVNHKSKAGASATLCYSPAGVPDSIDFFSVKLLDAKLFYAFKAFGPWDFQPQRRGFTVCGEYKV